MEREILFRGKRVEEPIKIIPYAPNGWVYGDLITCDDGSFILPHDISGEMYIDRPYKFRANDVEARVMLAKVDPNTIGQYTGFKDKNEKKIFGGDIIKVYGESYIEQWKDIGVVEYFKGAFGVSYENGKRFLAFNDMSMYIRGYEIIGNIHDNKELIERE